MGRAVALLLVLGLPALAVLLAIAPGAEVEAAAQSCRRSDPDRLDFRFCADSGGWVGGFADLPAAERDGDLYGLSFRRAKVPRAPSGHRVHGLRLSGDNRSDDLFMYVKRQITGLRPHAVYAIRLRFTLYSNAGEGCAGIGGAPGESVYVKAGGVAIEPDAVESGDGGLAMNLDKGDQSRGGADAALVGDLAAAGANCDGTVFVPKRFTTRRGALASETDRDGNLWVLIGTDSGFEGRTTYFITHIRLRLRRLPE
jgi:hypothetical protein